MSSSSRKNGFCTKSTAPSFIASTAVSTVPKPVMMMKAASTRASRSFRRMSRPEMPGIRMSDRMTSKAPLRASSKPSSPVGADCTVYPALRRVRSMLSRTPGSSSMRRIRDIRSGRAHSDSKLTPPDADTHNMRQTPHRRPASRGRRPRLRLLAAVAALAAIGAACTAGRGASRIADGRLPAHLKVRLDDGSVRTLALEEYVRGTAIAEFAPAAGDEGAVARMLEVQTIIARTYAVSHVARHGRDGFDLCAETHCQLYRPARLQTSRWGAAAAAAASRTAGRVLWHGTSPAEALFHADCGGHTSAAGDVWGGRPQPYLRAGADDGPAGSAHTSWTYAVEATRLAAVLDGDSRTRVGTRLQAVRVLTRDTGGRAGLVALQGDREPLVRGEEFRAIVTRALGPRTLRSTRFVVTRQGSRFVFEGQGFGHGVGLCQAGAFARIKAGARPDEVLARYYPGASVVAVR